ncbi:hypothetical protein [Marinobacterium jannaschii]|uniref:hypothetical protein n=1 Tax=Marinobacterium jannaschii TaxID=64970 RepID=UPI000AE751E2|nr:hypothetical protein [Marinobacterium jannaschii]
MNAHNALLALLLVLMALNSCESPVTVAMGGQGQAVATIYLDRQLQLPLSLLI